MKLISGDHPATLGAISRPLHLAGQASPVDGRSLPADGAQLARIVEHNQLFGRITPHQKRDLVTALKSRGHVVAMVGDGVNDVLALKDADIGIAMASGSSASRAVAQVILMANEFSVLPSVIGEGRRVIANIERLANLYITKTVYAFLLVIAIGVMSFPFPFLPRHLTLVGSLSIGIPSFFLALAPNAARARPGFLNRVLRFSVPAGIVAAIATFSAYALVLDSPYASFAEAQTVATMVLIGTGFWLLSVLARPLTPWKISLISGMVAVFLLILALPITRRFFALDIPSVLVTLAALVIVAIAGAAIELGWRLSRWGARARAPTHDLSSGARPKALNDGHGSLVPCPGWASGSAAWGPMALPMSALRDDGSVVPQLRVLIKGPTNGYGQEPGSSKPWPPGSGKRSVKTNELIYRLPDKRSGRVVFLSQCLLNQNVRYLGGATRAGVVDEIVDGYQREGIGICQMACPEQLAWGGVLKRHTLRSYGSRSSVLYRVRRSVGELFRRYTEARYRLLARGVARQIADYLGAGMEVVGVVGIGGSPSCGVNTTMDLGQAVDGVSRCELSQFTTVALNEGIVLSSRRPGPGLFVQALQGQLARRHLTTPFLEHDLSHELVRTEVAAVREITAG